MASGPLERRFSFLRQSSLAPPGKPFAGLSREQSLDLLTAEQLDATLELLFYASKGKLDGIRSTLNKKVSVDAADFDQRTALHVAACEGQLEVVKLLLDRGANVNTEDRWGSTPLADAQHYGNIDICEILEQKGGRVGAKDPRNSLMRTSTALVPEYEIDKGTLNFNVEQPSAKADLYRAALWQGTKVWVKLLPGLSLATNDHLARKFKYELELLLTLRHPNVVQFIGAVTQTSPMMIVTEFLSGGNLKSFMEEQQRRLEVTRCVSFALDIARGLNCLHEHRPEPIIHRDVKPSNLLLDESSRHIKVANFGLSQALREEATGEESAVLWTREGSFGRYMAPEIYEHGSYDKSVDTFAFGVILQEMLEGHPPLPEIKDDLEVAKAYAEGERPSFRRGVRRYPSSLKELIEECWHRDPHLRPAFSDIIPRLEFILNNSGWRSKLKSLLPGL